jgi:hypothetical protein
MEPQSTVIKLFVFSGTVFMNTLAITSFPVPLSPIIKTDIFVD